MFRNIAEIMSPTCKIELITPSLYEEAIRDV